MKEEEARILVVISGLEGQTAPYAVKQRTQCQQDLVSVRHAITARKPAKARVETLTFAMTRAIDNREAKQDAIDAADVKLQEAFAVCEQAESDRASNEKTP